MNGFDETELHERGLWVLFGERAESDKSHPDVQHATLKARVLQALKLRNKDNANTR